MARSDKIVELAREWRALNPAPLDELAHAELGAVLAGDTLPPVRFAAFGASNTALASGDASWVTHMGAPLEHVGGFAHGGYKTAQVADNTTPVECDIAIIMCGSNDVGDERWGTPHSVVLSAIRDIIVKSAAPRAIVSAIAPRRGVEMTRTVEHNARVQQFCKDMGWRFVDPWVTVRAANGDWAHHTQSVDGLHPTPTVAARAARDLTPAVRAFCW